MPPLVSVIIPVYNVKPFLCESLNSVIHQSYQNLEIIIVDDGSTDGSSQICDEYQNKDKRICVIHQTNRGLSNARNTGLDNLHGDIVAFLDPDDAYLPKMIEIMVNGMIDTDADIVACGYYICQTTNHMSISQHNSTFSMKNAVLSAEQALQYLSETKINIPVWNKLYRRELFNHTRFLEGHVYEDLILTPFIFEKARVIMLINQHLLLYRIHACSLTSSINARNRLDWLYARNIAEQFINERTPTIFSCKQRNAVLEKYSIRLIKDYLALLKTKELNPEMKRILNNEIEKKARQLKRFCFRTKLIYSLFMINPYLCLFIERCRYYGSFCCKKVKGLLVRDSLI